MVATFQKIRNLRLFKSKRPEHFENSKQIVLWWEIRRLPYNVIVGAAGIISCLLLGAIAIFSDNKWGEPIGLPDPPLFAVVGIVLFGIAANFCYTFGWLIELFVKAVWQKRSGSFGEIAFALGIVFSVLITFAPPILCAIVVVVKLLKSN